MMSFSALSAVNVILLSRSLSSNVIFTPKLNRNIYHQTKTALPGIFISTFAVDWITSLVIGLKTFKNSSEKVDSQAKPTSVIDAPLFDPRCKSVI